MQQLTEQQIADLANDLLMVSQAIGDYRYVHNACEGITAEQNIDLGSLQWTILSYADDLFTQSAVLAMEDAPALLCTIRSVTTKIRADYKSIKDFQKAINVATAVTTLGAAIIKKSQTGIGAGVQEVVDAWNA